MICTGSWFAQRNCVLLFIVVTLHHVAMHKREVMENKCFLFMPSQEIDTTDGQSSTSCDGALTFGSDSAIELGERSHFQSSGRNSIAGGSKPKSRYEMRLERLAGELSDDFVKSDEQINQEYQTMIFDEGTPWCR